MQFAGRDIVHREHWSDESTKAQNITAQKSFVSCIILFGTPVIRESVTGSCCLP